MQRIRGTRKTPMQSTSTVEWREYWIHWHPGHLSSNSA